LIIPIEKNPRKKGNIIPIGIGFLNFAWV